MRFSELVDTSRSIAQTRARSSKIAHLAECLRRMTPEEIPSGVALLSGSPRQGKVGVGPAALSRARSAIAARASGLELLEVDRAFGDIAAIAGRGAESRRAERLGALLARATREEQEFLLRVAIGELRQGALEGLVADAIAAAF
ncbi:MAG: ATP-dependent DNA ligase, partial [Candidatus Binatia bacterium]